MTRPELRIKDNVATTQPRKAETRLVVKGTKYLLGEGRPGLAINRKDLVSLSD